MGFTFDYPQHSMEIRGKAAESLLPFHKVEGVDIMVQVTN